MQKKIMILGTASGVGKSIITAGVCRIFLKDGYSVAPFKAQNMSRNSYGLKNGKELSTAQFIQAKSCKIEPREYMNPLLLKPLGNNLIDVFLNGESFCKMSGKDYTKEKSKFKKDIIKSFEKLKDYDVVVIEGAGSPAEINIKENDIVNMGMAEMVDSPVILVADIDRGGVFASIVGTIILLEEQERKRVKGIIINKFRGTKEILDSGIEKIEKMMGIKVLGVVPYVDVRLEEEDSLMSKDRKEKVKKITEEEEEKEFEKLEKVLRENLDMKYIYKILGDEK